MSRRRRAALIGLCLVGAVLLIGLDRTFVGPQWPGRFAGDEPRRRADFARYHGSAFPVGRIVDGDTLDLNVPDRNRSTTRVRLLGIDAPELGHDGAPAMHYAREARMLAEHLARGQTVTVYLDEQAGSRGRYGRLLGYVELPDGTFLNERLLVGGGAYADPRFRHSYYQKYRQLEAGARALGEGLWAQVSEEQMPIWWRRAQKAVSH